MPPAGDDPRHTLSDVIGKEAARQFRNWERFKAQFTATSLGVIGGLAVSAGGIIGGLYLSQQKLATRVVVLETQIVPDLTLRQKVAEHEAKIANLERNYDFAREHAGDAPVPGAHVAKSKVKRAK